MSKKFDFGKNWFKFSKLVDEQRIESAEHSLKKIININLKNKNKKIYYILCPYINVSCVMSLQI